jgi:hypothetical protein
MVRHARGDREQLVAFRSVGAWPRHRERGDRAAAAQTLDHFIMAQGGSPSIGSRHAADNLYTALQGKWQGVAGRRPSAISGPPLRGRLEGCTGSYMPVTRLKRHRWPISAWGALLPALMLLCLFASPLEAQTTPSGASPGRTPVLEPGKSVLSLSASFGTARDPVRAGLQWRIYQERAQPDGAHTLVAESNEALPTLTIPDGDYVVHVSYGLASAMKRVAAEGKARDRTVVTLERLEQLSRLHRPHVDLKRVAGARADHLAGRLDGDGERSSGTKPRTSRLYPCA